MTSLQIVSDLHLEFYKNIKNLPTITKHAPYLIICGDLGNPYQDTYKHFIETQSNQFDKVFILKGNHCIYSSKHTYVECIEQIQKVCDLFENVYFLDNDIYNLTDKTTIIASTLWSDIKNHVAYMLSDFKCIIVSKEKSLIENKRPDIKMLNPDIYREWNRKDIKFIEDSIKKLKEENKEIIVLTHHAPHKKMGGIYEGNEMSSAFVNDLEYLFDYPVVCWCSAHVHSNVDTKINNIRSVSNCMGYKNENTGYKENVVITFN